MHYLFSHSVWKKSEKGSNVLNLNRSMQVREATLTEALTKKKTTAGGETVVMNYNMADVSQGSYRIHSKKEGYGVLMQGAVQLSLSFLTST